MKAPLDLRSIATSVDLRTTIENATGQSFDRSGNIRCCFHDDRRPSLSLNPDGKHFRCWSCGVHGDVFDFVMQFEEISLVEAAQRLDPTFGMSMAGKTSKTPAIATHPRVSKPERPPAWQDATWRCIIEDFVDRCERILWSQDGHKALAWLAGRGLEMHTIRRFRLGFNPDSLNTDPLACLPPWPNGDPKGVYAQRGITMPWCLPNATYADRRLSGLTDGEPQWCGVQVRGLTHEYLDPPDKAKRYRAITGSQRGFLYPWPTIEPTQGFVPCLLVEGEPDALIGNQAFGHLVHVASVGGATQFQLQDATIAAVARCPWLLLGQDSDRAGVDAVWFWQDQYPHKARRVLLPPGFKDIGDAQQAGVDLVQWLTGEMRRLGIGRASG